MGVTFHLPRRLALSLNDSGAKDITSINLTGASKSPKPPTLSFGSQFHRTSTFLLYHTVWLTITSTSPSSAGPSINEQCRGAFLFECHFNP